MKLQGIFSEITTPFDYKGDIYKVKVQHNIEKWNRTTLTGYLVNGPTGENAFLSSDEKAMLWELSAKYAAAEKVLIAGTGVEGVRETVSLTNRAAEMGYKAAMIAVPRLYGTRLKTEAQMLYLRTVADQARIPIIVHNCPDGAEADLGIEGIAAVAQHANVIGVNQGSGNSERMAALVREARGLQVLAGSASTVWHSLQSGAQGAILAFASAAPYAVIAIWEAHRTREETAGAELQNRLAGAARLVEQVHGVPGLKHAMDINGYYGGPPRLPLTVPAAEAKREIEEAFRGLSG